MTFQKIYNEKNLNAYTDRIDVDLDISLYEYGVVRNPKTGRTIFCINPTGDYPDSSYVYKYEVGFISVDDVKKALNELSVGYFDFIGSSLDTELEYLDNSSLANHIYSINMYEWGHFETT